MTAGTAQGWPFLVARGRRRGYSVLLAPGFLIDEQDYGFLEEAAGPVRDSERARVLATTSPRGRPVCLVWSEHEVTAVDLASDADPRDEHSRPLRLLNGFLCVDGTISDPARADVAFSRHAALDTYRRFLAGEDRFTIEPSTPFDIQSTLDPRVPRRRPEARPVPVRPPRRLVAPFAVAGALVIGVLVAVIGLGSATSKQPPTCTSITPTPTATVGTTTAPTPPRPSTSATPIPGC